MYIYNEEDSDNRYICLKYIKSTIYVFEDHYCGIYLNKPRNNHEQIIGFFTCIFFMKYCVKCTFYSVIWLQLKFGLIFVKKTWVNTCKKYKWKKHAIKHIIIQIINSI